MAQSFLDEQWLVIRRSRPRWSCERNLCRKYTQSLADSRTYHMNFSLAQPLSSAVLLPDNAAMAQPPNQPPEGPKLHKEGVPEGLWMRCPDCGDMLFRKVVEESLHVCPNCQYHF